MLEKIIEEHGTGVQSVYCIVVFHRGGLKKSLVLSLHI